MGTILASAGGVFEALPKPWKGLTILGLALSMGFSGGVAFSIWGSDFTTHETRIVTLEDWRSEHTREVSEPGLARIGALEERADATASTVEDIREMVFELYCRELPAKCQGVPR